jgi:transcriptional regulator with XRE-family HTH domain
MSLTLWTPARGARWLPRMAPSPEPQPGLGRALRQLREERGLTQEEVAHRADLHATWISHLESGRINPRWGVARRLAAALDVDLSELAALAEKLGP